MRGLGLCDNWGLVRQKPVSRAGTSNYIPQIEAEAGGRLNKKDGLTRYVNSHVKDKTS